MECSNLFCFVPRIWYSQLLSHSAILANNYFNQLANYNFFVSPPNLPKGIQGVIITTLCDNVFHELMVFSVKKHFLLPYSSGLQTYWITNGDILQCLCECAATHSSHSFLELL